MSKFYELGFRLTFHFVAKSDKKRHLKNKKRPDVGVAHLPVPQTKDFVNILRTTEEKRPLLLDIHGGGWMYGDENLNLDFGKWFSEQGFHVAMPSYPLIYDGTIKDMVHSLYRTLAFLREEAERLHIDVDNAHIVGDSAGAGLALLLCAIDGSEVLQRLYEVPSLPISFSSLLLYHPCCYPKRMTFVAKPKFMDKGPRRTFFRLYCGKNGKEFYDKADFPDYAATIRRLPPTFLLTSTGDTFLNRMSFDLKEDFRRFGFPMEFVLIPDDTFGHVQSVTEVDEPSSVSANEKALDFLRRHSSDFSSDAS